MKGNMANNVNMYSTSQNILQYNDFSQNQFFDITKSLNPNGTQPYNDTKNKSDPLLPTKLIKTGLFITSLNIPQQMKDNLIKKVLKSSDFKINLNDSNFINLIEKKNYKNTKNSRVMFTKDEDEKIKQLVKKFGTHWDLIANFMERRTAKQCRDRYSNYLIPGFFQGEWSKEEDDLLTQLYNEIGPKWSVLQRYFPNRGANSIKNRWHYFLCKQKRIDSNLNHKNVTTDQISSQNFVSNNFDGRSKGINESCLCNGTVKNDEDREKNNLFDQDDDNKNTNLFEMDNEWMMFN